MGDFSSLYLYISVFTELFIITNHVCENFVGKAVLGQFPSPTNKHFREKNLELPGGVFDT